jgi:dTDP-4-dehydrorhamnose 3,5-epimerase
MKVIETPLTGVLLIQPRVFTDARGFFLEGFNEKAMAEAGIREHFVQDNHSFSVKNVLRGMHYQISRPQGKLVRIALGAIFDVAVDLRKNSATFGKWHGVVLSAENHHMLWVPAGFAHGFQVISDGAHVLYKTTDFYHAESERTIAWNDAELKIDWQLKGEPILSAKDAAGTSFRDAEVFG